MKSRTCLAIALLFCAVAVSACTATGTGTTETPAADAAPPAPTAAEQEAAVRAATDGFYAALNAMFTGEVVPMEAVWSHADDVTYMGPVGGLRKGWTEVLADWQAQADMKLGGQVNPDAYHITVGGDLAVVVNYEIGQNVAEDGTPEEVRIRATNTFRLEGGQWKMIGHHTDTLPYLAQ